LVWQTAIILTNIPLKFHPDALAQFPPRSPRFS